jgi:tetratricopeptide (TPR) repeat protein
LGSPTADSTQEWIDLQLDRIWACYLAARLPELKRIIDQSRAAIEEQGTLAQKARFYESLVLIDLRSFRYYQLPDQTLFNAKKQVEVAWSSGNRRAFGRAQTILGFVHLWRNELQESERYLRSGLKDIEAVGDVDTQFINLNYMALIGRKRGDIDLTLEWAERTLALVDKARNMFYRDYALGSLAWVHFHTGNEEQAQAYLQKVLHLNETVTSPLRFMALGPALAMEVRRENWEPAIEHVKALLHPSQQKMPDEIQSVLEQAVACWEAGDAESAKERLVTGIELMKQKQLGYV